MAVQDERMEGKGQLTKRIAHSSRVCSCACDRLAPALSRIWFSSCALPNMAATSSAELASALLQLHHGLGGMAVVVVWLQWAMLLIVLLTGGGHVNI